MKFMQVQFQDGKCFYITSGAQVLSSGSGPPMGLCNHEEADTRVLVHLLHALQNPSLEMIHTEDINVVVTLLSNFHHVMDVNPAAEI